MPLFQAFIYTACKIKTLPKSIEFKISKIFERSLFKIVD